MENLNEILNGLSQIVFGVTTVATIVVRITPTKSDDKKLNDILIKFHKYMGYFPTIGKNPKTKELENKLGNDAKTK
jgi:hypothetical protein